MGAVLEAVAAGADEVAVGIVASVSRWELKAMRVPSGER
jgi:hypothetical protein